MTETPLLPIGEVADRLGISTRTLRYYEQLGLVEPAGRSPGGSRRYSEHDVQRVRRIFELRDVLGFDLDQIAEILPIEQRYEDIRAVYPEAPTALQDQLLREADELNRRLRSHVEVKVTALSRFQAGLEERQRVIDATAREHGITLDGTSARR